MAITGRLSNNSLFINKLDKNNETLKDCCYNIDWDNAHGLGEQRRYVWEDWNSEELRLPKLKLQNNKIPTREEIEKKIKRYSMHDILNDRYTFQYRYTCEDGLKIESECSISTQAFVVPTLIDT